MIRTRVVVLLGLTTLLLACGAGGSSAPAPAAHRVEAPGLGIAIADLPEGLTVQKNEGGTLVLAPGGQAGRIVIEAGSPAEGTNLVQAVKDHQALVESRPEGHYLGVRELVTPLGSAYWSRGRYRDGTATVEETRIVTLHPSGERLLYLTYTYPAGGDSSARIQQLLGLVAEIEGAAQAPASAREG